MLKYPFLSFPRAIPAPRLLIKLISPPTIRAPQGDGLQVLQQLIWPHQPILGDVSHEGVSHQDAQLVAGDTLVRERGECQGMKGYMRSPNAVASSSR